VDLLTPYKEMTTHGQNYMRPPPDLINEKEEYKVEHVINSRQLGMGVRYNTLSSGKDTLTQTINGSSGRMLMPLT